MTQPSNNAMEPTETGERPMLSMARTISLSATLAASPGSSSCSR
jgi:hypothetical protein